MDQMLMDVMRIVGFKIVSRPLNDRLYGRAQSRTNFPSRRTRPRTFRRLKLFKSGSSRAY
jgi:hypothetical protein